MTYSYATKFNAYVGVLPTDITVQSSHYGGINYFSDYLLPTYEATLMNDTLVSPNNYEFDMFLKRTDINPFYFCGANICLLFDNSIDGGGELSSVYIPGSSQMNTAQIPADPNVSSVVGNKRVWKLSIPLSVTSYTVVNSTTNGTRFGRFRITTSAASFFNINANLSWNFNNTYYGYSTKIYSLGWNSDPWSGGYYAASLTDSTKHFNNLSNLPLPVELISFNAQITDNRKITLDWTTATEVNNYGFEVQRKVLSQQSAVGNNQFETIGFVNGNGNSSSLKNFSYIDNTLNGGSKFAYRLKQIDINGTFTYSSIQEVELILSEYVLSQNYPNPFNPTTMIEYIIPQAGQVSLSVYDVLGERVSEFKESGIYTVDFDASNLSSGSYIYVLRANGNTISKKLTVIK